MDTVFDFISVGLFAGLAILFLQRSAAEEADTIPMWQYGVAAVMCAGGNYLGNHEQPIYGGLILAATTVYSVFILKMFGRPSVQE